jgi:predicted ATPase/DNA-binding SARP family transcriptional activator
VSLESESDLIIRLFGAADVRLRDRPLPRLQSRKALSLLALLALRPGGVERAWLAAVLWPDSRQDRGLFYLRRTLADLRRALGEAAGRLCCPTDRALSLDLTDVWVDVVRFDAAIARGDPASLEEATALYRGPLLPECIDTWAAEERRAREEAFVAALETLAGHALAAGDPSTAERHLRRAVATDPFRESARRGLMQALAAAGNTAGALRSYSEFRTLLRQEFQAEPDPETTAFAESLRSQPAPIAVTAGAGTLDAPSSNGASAALPLPRRAPEPGRPLTRFIGREREVGEIRQLLGSARLLTLTGAGGCGKTRLAREIAMQVRDGFPDGVWWVDLAPVATPSRVPESVAEVLEVREEVGRPVTATLAEFLATRQMLLVLDNCEHVILACAHLVESLLQACPRLKVLATSRETLSLPGELPYRVEGLTLPPEGAVDATMLPSYAATALFLDRAATAAPGFALTPENAGVIAAICRRLDGIPLAIELAAARLKVLSPGQILDRLNDRFGLLVGGSRTALPRHQTLRAAIDWSYALLSAPEQILLGRLSVFAGGWTLDAAEAICAGEQVEAGDVLQRLSQLVEKSLVQTWEPETGEERRFGMLETIREYGRERLEERGEASGIRRRHLEYYLWLAEDTEPRLNGPAMGTWLRRLEQEYHNVRAALDAGEDLGEIETALRLAGTMRVFWFFMGHWAEEKERLMRLLARADPSARTVGRAKALYMAAYLAGVAGDRDGERCYLEECLELFRELDERPEVAVALRGLGHGTAATLEALGLNAVAEGKLERARALYEESLALFRAARHPAGAVWALYGLGDLAMLQGDEDEARRRWEEGISVIGPDDDPSCVAWGLDRLAGLAERQGDRQRARSLFEESLRIFRELKLEAPVARVLSKLAALDRS